MKSPYRLPQNEKDVERVEKLSSVQRIELDRLSPGVVFKVHTLGYIFTFQVTEVHHVPITQREGHPPRTYVKVRVLQNEPVDTGYESVNQKNMDAIKDTLGKEIIIASHPAFFYHFLTNEIQANVKSFLCLMFCVNTDDISVAQQQDSNYGGLSFLTPSITRLEISSSHAAALAQRDALAAMRENYQSTFSRFL